jgi:hypothetical protein
MTTRWYLPKVLEMLGLTGLRSYLIHGAMIWQCGIDGSGIRNRKYLGFLIMLYSQFSPGCAPLNVSAGGCMSSPAGGMLGSDGHCSRTLHTSSSDCSCVMVSAMHVMSAGMYLVAAGLSYLAECGDRDQLSMVYG